LLSTDFSTNCAPNLIQIIDIFITLGNKSAENKGLECKSKSESFSRGIDSFSNPAQ